MRTAIRCFTTGQSRININGAMNAQATIELYEKIQENNLGKEQVYAIEDNARHYRNV